MNGRMTESIRANMDQAYKPQWSRPMNGRMTSPFVDAGTGTTSPQWSRPMNGRMTTTAVFPEVAMVKWPQWSRPMNGRMTRRRACRPGRSRRRNGAGR